MDSILKRSKDFLIKNSYRPRYFSNKKLEFRCLAVLVEGNPLEEAQRILMLAGNEGGFNSSFGGNDLLRSLIHFKIEGYGLENMIYWPSIRWDEEEIIKNNDFKKSNYPTRNVKVEA